jgi:hypothetical protein
MAKARGVSPATVHRIWSAPGLKPHRVKTFKLSNGKRFEEKLVRWRRAVLNPPEKAAVLCMDERDHGSMSSTTSCARRPLMSGSRSSGERHKNHGMSGPNAPPLGSWPGLTAA